jgi:hypothetical protein
MKPTRRNLKNEMIDLISGSHGNQKQDIFIADNFGCSPGYYRYDNKIYNQAEFDELTKGCGKVVVFSLAKGKTELSDKVFPITGMAIIPDSPEKEI